MIPEDVKEIVERFTCEYAPHLREIVQLDMALAIAADRASRLTRQEDEIRKAALEEACWFWTWDKLPKPGRKFIAVYNDGSGACMFYACDDGVIDHEGDEYGGFTESFDRWAYLPDDCEFWCETRSEDPYTFPRALSQKGDEADG